MLPISTSSSPLDPQIALGARLGCSGFAIVAPLAVISGSALCHTIDLSARRLDAGANIPPPLPQADVYTIVKFALTFANSASRFCALISKLHRWRKPRGVRNTFTGRVYLSVCMSFVGPRSCLSSCDESPCPPFPRLLVAHLMSDPH